MNRKAASAALLGFLVACSSPDPDGGENTSGGKTSSGGANPGTGGTSPSSGGATFGGASTGGAAQSGGASATGGKAGAGGVATSGGASSGGAAGTMSGGTSSGGVGGVTSGGTASGGAATSGGANASGGASSGGAASGGAKASGGTSSGGASSGGMTGTGGATSGDQCKAMGWATRTGRTGSAFNVTGGGNATPVVAKSFADLQMWASDGQARVIHVDGTLGAGWSGRSGDRLAVKSNKTIVGMRPGTQLKAPIHINGATNVIIRNLVITGPGSNDEQAWDNLSIEGDSKNVWIDHCEFWDGQDGNADVVKGADTVTFTWNIFGYKKGGAHNFSNLIASSDNEPASVGKLNVTFMFNHFSGIAQRQPRCRYGFIHVVNNYFSKDGMQSDYGISAGLDCKIFAENNYFYQINNPLTDQHATDQQNRPAGIKESGNTFDGTTGSKAGYGEAFTPPYEYSALLMPAAQVKAAVQANAGAKLASPSACSP